MYILGFFHRVPLKLVHGWDRIKDSDLYSLLALSTHKTEKMLP